MGICRTVLIRHLHGGRELLQFAFRQLLHPRIGIVQREGIFAGAAVHDQHAVIALRRCLRHSASIRQIHLVGGRAALSHKEEVQLVLRRVCGTCAIVLVHV